MGPGWAAALWGFVVSDDLDGGRNTASKRPGCVDTRGGRLQWPSRQALGGHQRALGALITVIGLSEITAGVEPAHRNGEVAMLTVGLSHDVSTMLGIGHHLGSQPRAKASITIMRAPQRGHGQGSTRRASGVISGCSCGSAGRDDMEQCAGGRDVLSAVGVGKEPIVADAVSAKIAIAIVHNRP